MQGVIGIRGVRQHNLKGWDLDIPIGRWITITGVSGSGKSSLAMDVLYAEGQRRYVETFSPYARQFLERMDRPNVDEVRGIPPALAIEGTHPVRTSRSTVGTMTELTDFLKLLYARMAVPFCPSCNEEIRRTTPDELWEESLKWTRPTPWFLTFPVNTKGRDKEEIRKGLLRMGFFRLLRDGQVVDVDDALGQPGEETQWVVADRLVAPPDSRERFVDSVETAFRYGRGELAVHFQDGTTQRWTNQWRCLQCGVTAHEPSPNLFSFNSPVGACPTCRGFGRVIDIDPELVVPDGSKSIAQGAVRPFAIPAARMEMKDLLRFCKRNRIPTDIPWRELDAAQQRAIFEGTDGYYGVKGFFKWLEGKSYKIHVRVFLSRFRAYVKCPTCEGARLRQEALQWKIHDKTLPELCALDVGRCLEFMDHVRSVSGHDPALHLLVGEITQRLRYLSDVGLSFLTLDRPSRTLSGGEVERVMLTRALGSRLVNTLFVLDEPSVGLHARDTERLIGVIRNLVYQGNTVTIVEHDPDIIACSDELIDLGPGAGGRGGGLIFFGPPGRIGEEAPESLTGRYLAGTRVIPVPKRRRRPSPDRAILLRSVQENNLKGMDLVIPLGVLVCITGVSGSGKSTLVLDILYRGLLRAKGVPCERPGRFGGLDGAQWVDHVELVDQRGLGRTPRANVATYTKAWEGIRKAFSSTDEARRQGRRPGDFSFNVPGGRCETCRGEGFTRVEMQFLSDVLLRCPDCQGRRFRGEILHALYKGRSIADVLEMTVEEAISFFSSHSQVVKALEPLLAMGLGYLPLGQSLSTLSGGEAQRLRLARFLGDAPGRTLFILDEPTTGLHMEDVRTLLKVLGHLVEQGHSVVVVEHHLDVIKSADHVIDLGPEGGEDGGWVVAQGTPEEIALSRDSHTGRYLRE
ncbi:MAG: excinuclease ABC subunit UvrA, partial [Thermodesulfobacteriota bacterium]